MVPCHRVPTQSIKGALITMMRTEYSWMETKELLLFVLNSKKATSLEVELAQRLTLAQDMIAERERMYGDNPRRPRQSGGS